MREERHGLASRFSFSPMDSIEVENMKKFIEMDHVSYSYRQDETMPLLAVDNVCLSIPSGSHIAVLGRNGSGKSTLARLINALEQPQDGIVHVAGMTTAEEEKIWEIRRLCGMVFQNPDNQIVGTTVEEDVAFGPENLGFPQPVIRKSVDESLAYVGLGAMAQKPPHLLSGGQKQKLAIAGILAMRPSCLILDEATSMLDPVSRQEFMELVLRLIHDEGMTVINITHNMEEALLADHVYVMSDGHIVLQGTAGFVFDQVDVIRKLGLDVPAHSEIAHELALIAGEKLKPMEAVSWEGAVSAVKRLLADCDWQSRSQELSQGQDKKLKSPLSAASKSLITVENLTYTYTAGTVFASEALKDVSFDVRQGELLGIIGHSGSGKSTLIQHLNGLLRTQKGKVRVFDLNASQNQDIRKIRQRVGLVFQYPEHQLFEETVFQDIAFGPKRLGLDMPLVEQRVLKAARIVGLSDEMLERSPFELSGGQKRRAAIAGILAMEPDVLILDEPAAGLDPAGRDEILGYAAKLRAMGSTVILVSHNMEDIARLADRVLVLNHGQVQAFGSPEEVFAEESLLIEAGLTLPRSVSFLRTLSGFLPGLDCNQYTAKSAARQLAAAYVRYLNERKAGENDAE